MKHRKTASIIGLIYFCIHQRIQTKITLSCGCAISNVQKSSEDREVHAYNDDLEGPRGQMKFVSNLFREREEGNNISRSLLLSSNLKYIPYLYIDIVETTREVEQIHNTPSN